MNSSGGVSRRPATIMRPAVMAVAISPQSRFAFVAAVSGLTLIALSGCGDDRPNLNAKGPPPLPAEVRGAPVIGCQRGGGPFVAGWRTRNSVIAGPLGFAYAGELARHPEIVRPAVDEPRRLLTRPDTPEAVRRRARRTLRAAPENGYGVSETPVVVEAGREATVVVPRSARRHVSLVYTHRAASRERSGAQGIYRVADGDLTVTFKACRDHETHFLGGFVAAGARCVPLEIWILGRGQPIRRTLSFGAGPCAGLVGRR